MPESVAQMAPMVVLGGLIAGWVAEAASRAGGYGLLVDMSVGLAGSALGVAALWLILGGAAPMATTLFVGCAGAALAIVGQRTLWRSSRSAA